MQCSLGNSGLKLATIEYLDEFWSSSRQIDDRQSKRLCTAGDVGLGVGSGRHGEAPLLLSRIDLRQCSRLFIAYLEVQTETAREVTCQRQLEKRSAVVMLLPNVDGARAWRGRRRRARRMKGWPVTMMDWSTLN